MVNYETELGLFRGYLEAEGVSRRACDSYLSALKGWFRSVDGGTPNGVSAQHYLNGLQQEGDKSLGAVSYAAGVIERYLRWTGTEVRLEHPLRTLACQGWTPEQHANVTKFRRDNYVFAYSDGKRRMVFVPSKRPKPKSCELCGRQRLYREIDYHHWDNSDLSRGLWLCGPCHLLAEAVDKGGSPELIEKYLTLKGNVNDGIPLQVAQEDKYGLKEAVW